LFVCVGGEGRGTHVTFAYDIFIGDRENRGLKREKDTALILDFAFI